MTRPVFDVHVHLAGFGGEGSGCYFDPRRARSLAFRFIRSLAGLPPPPRIARGAAGPDPARPCPFDRQLRESVFGFAREAEHAITLLAFDWRHDADGTARPEKSDFYTPDDYVLSLAREARPLPDGSPSLRAGISVHPYRDDAVERLERGAAEGAALVKWLATSQNIDPADPRCRDYYAALVRLGLPLLAHTGSEGATRNINKAWNDPRSLRPALDAGVTVIAAHCGMRSLPNDRDHLDAWIAMLKDYPNLYGDTAALFLLRPRRLARALDRPLVAERLVHGSDWPVPQHALWFRGLIHGREFAALKRERNPLKRDLMAKRLIGIPEESFYRGWELIN